MSTESEPKCASLLGQLSALFILPTTWNKTYGTLNKLTRTRNKLVQTFNILSLIDHWKCKISRIVHQSLQLEMDKWVGVIYRMSSSSDPLISLLCKFQTVTVVYFHKDKSLYSVTALLSITLCLAVLKNKNKKNKNTDDIIVGELWK